MEFQEEQWRSVPEFPGYLVSDQGRVRGVSGRILAPRISNVGYPRVSLRRDGCTIDQLTHRVVLAAFRGPCPDGYEGAHLNGNPADTRLSNLAWVTHSENLSHRVGHGTANRGERHGNAKITAGLVRQIRRAVGGGMTQRRAAEVFSISNQQVSRIITGKQWGWLDA